MSPLHKGRLAEVLLVEDNDNDVVLTHEGFNAANFRVNLHHVNNGEKCLQFLRREPPYESAPEPDLILLDLNMPVMTGREVLDEIKRDPALQGKRVVVLTTSSAEADVLAAYQSIGCSSYIVKPVDFDKFLNVISEIGEYWLTMVVLPKDTAPV